MFIILFRTNPKRVVGPIKIGERNYWMRNRGATTDVGDEDLGLRVLGEEELVEP